METKDLQLRGESLALRLPLRYESLTRDNNAGSDFAFNSNQNTVENEDLQGSASHRSTAGGNQCNRYHRLTHPLKTEMRA